MLKKMDVLDLTNRVKGGTFMKIRILSALVSMTFMLLFVPTAMANSEASKIKAGMVVVVNNPDAEDRLNLRTEPGCADAR